MKNKIAVVGCGRWGKNLVRVFNELGVLYAMCDIKGGEYPSGVRFYYNYDELLDNTSIDAVVLATPANKHYQMAREALQCEKDVFVEKPLALNCRHGEDLVDLAKRFHRILMVGHILEYHPAIIKLKKLIDDGELGKINYVYSNRLNFGRFRKEENVLWSFAPHDISAILYLLGEIPSHVMAYGGNYLREDLTDITVTNLEFASGAKAHIFVSWLHPYKEQRLVVTGTRKMAVFDGTQLFTYGPIIQKGGKIYTPFPAKKKLVRIAPTEPLKNECKHFLKCLKTREEPRTSGRKALQVLGVLEACQDSLKVGIEIDNTEKIRLANLETPFVHESSYVDEDVKIGEGTKIWHFCHVQKGARIGKNCTIGQNVNIGPGVSIGDNVKIQNNVSVYEGVTLEDDVFIGPSVVFTNVRRPEDFGSDREFIKTYVCNGTIIGANATIVCGIRIGEKAFVGAGSVVTDNVEAGSLVYGVPARVHKKRKL